MRPQRGGEVGVIQPQVLVAHHLNRDAGEGTTAGEGGAGRGEEKYIPSYAKEIKEIPL